MKPEEIVDRIEHAPQYTEEEVAEAITALVGCDGCQGSGIQQGYKCPDCFGLGVEIERVFPDKARNGKEVNDG